MLSKQANERIAQALPEILLDESAAALTAQQQTFRFQTLYGFAKGWT